MKYLIILILVVIPVFSMAETFEVEGFFESSELNTTGEYEGCVGYITAFQGTKHCKSGIVGFSCDIGMQSLRPERTSKMFDYSFIASQREKKVIIRINQARRNSGICMVESIRVFK